jgi:hypothetical protein
MNRIVIFDTTHHALWAEEVARDRGIAVEVIPAPEGVDAKCGMALEVLEESFEDLQSIFAQEGIPYKIYN